MNQRYIPKDSTFVPHESGAVAYYFTTPQGKPAAMGYPANATKNPAFRYAFRTETERQNYIDNWFANLEAHAAKITERREAAKSWKHGFTVGTILYGSWGYDQTNVEFYEVTGTKEGSNFVTIRELAHKSGGNAGFMCEDRLPDPGHYIGEEERHLAQMNDRGGYVVIDPKGIRLHLSKWDGTAKYCSWYA